MSACQSQDGIRYVQGPAVTFERMVETPQKYMKDLAAKVVKPVTLLFDKDNDLEDRDRTGAKIGYGTALEYFCKSVAATYGSVVDNGHDWLRQHDRIRRIPERLVQGKAQGPNGSATAQWTGGKGKWALMDIVVMNGGERGKDVIKDLWSRVLLKGMLVDLHCVLLRFLAPIIMAEGESFSNRSWEGNQDPVPAALVELESQNPYFKAQIRRPDTAIMVKYPSFYKVTRLYTVTNVLKYRLPFQWDRLFGIEILRDASLVEGFTPRQCESIGRVILAHIEKDLRDLPECQPGTPSMPHHLMLSKVFRFLIKADSVQKNWFLCCLMTARYPDWDEPFVIPRPAGVENDIQFFGFDNGAGDDDECTTTYMQGVVQASFHISSLLKERCSANLAPVECQDIKADMRRSIRTAGILKNRRAIHWARTVRKMLRGADALAQSPELARVIRRSRIGSGTGPSRGTQAAVFLRAVVHARLLASGETLVFN